TANGPVVASVPPERQTLSTPAASTAVNQTSSPARTMASGHPDSAPGTRSRNRPVPAGVPSVAHSSDPCSSSHSANSATGPTAGGACPSGQKWWEPHGKVTDSSGCISSPKLDQITVSSPTSEPPITRPLSSPEKSLRLV